MQKDLRKQVFLFVREESRFRSSSGSLSIPADRLPDG